MNVLLHAPSDFSNLCVMIRTLECFGMRECAVFDPHKMIRERYGKSYGRRLRSVSAGAFARIQFTVIEDTESFIRSSTGRAIATVTAAPSQSLYDFRFEDDDLLVFGSEASGLPDAVVAACDHRITIPQTGVTQSLNLCVAAGIIVSEWSRQRGGATRGQEGGFA